MVQKIHLRGVIWVPGQVGPPSADIVPIFAARVRSPSIQQSLTYVTDSKFNYKHVLDSLHCFVHFFALYAFSFCTYYYIGRIVASCQNCKLSCLQSTRSNDGIIEIQSNYIQLFYFSIQQFTQGCTLLQMYPRENLGTTTSTWWAESAPSPGWDRVKASENLGANAVDPVAN